MPQYAGLMDPRVVQALAEFDGGQLDHSTPEGRAAATGLLAGIVERATGRSCAGCTLCCKLSGIPELAKPPLRWCTHCNPSTGCNIYADRPRSCREFICAWRAGYGPEELKPSRVRFFAAMEALPDGAGNLWHFDVDSSRPQAWREQSVINFIKAIQATGDPVIIRLGGKVIELTHQGPTRNRRTP